MYKIELKKRILFVGIPDMAYICLEGLLMSGANVVGVMGPKKNHVTYSNFKDFVLSKNLNFIEWDSLKDEKFLQTIKDLNVDLAIVCSFNYKVPKILLDSVKDGFVNLHPSYLPHYRGSNPYSHPIINNEKFTGVTLHFMNENFDEGDIIIQQKLPITPLETMGTLFNRTNLMGLELLIKIINEYENGNLNAVKQIEGDFKLAKTLAEEDLFINFETPAEDIERFVRGLNPFVIASTVFRGTLVKVFAAQVDNSSSNKNHPAGEIVKVDSDRFYIATKSGLLAPTVLQFGSFFLGTSQDFIRMISPKVGEQFGG